jgi:exodeoxyribonuclease VII large subunit
MDDGTLFGRDEEVPPTLTVGELSARIARLTATAFPSDLWVSGQIRNLNRSSAGHVYFDLAEPSPAGRAPLVQLSVTLLAPERQLVNRQLTAAGGAVRMDDGIEVRIQGRLRWYAPRGTLQFRMHGIDPSFTLGRLQADRERTLATLRAEGLLEANHGRSVPPVPLRVGLVTSRNSAAFADAVHELEASGFGFQVRFVDARTQGADCGGSVVRALARLAEDRPDVILLVRGGGSRTDLSGFDGEDVARAIAGSPVPVFTGIGHEVDRSIADEVAHSAHKTPTAAAAAVVATVRAFVDRLDACWAAVRHEASGAADAADLRLSRRADRVAVAARRDLRAAEVTSDDRARRVVRGAVRSLDRADQALSAGVAAAGRSAARGVDRAVSSVDLLEARVAVHDPVHALARGWSITTTADGRPVDPARLAPGDELRTRVAGAEILSTVSAVSAPPSPPSTDPGPGLDPDRPSTTERRDDHDGLPERRPEP